MATPALVLKRGDTSPAFRAQCLDGTTPVNLTGATARLVMKQRGSALPLSLPLTLESAAEGRVRRAWQATDLNVSGTYLAEVEVTWTDGTVQTFPADGYTYVTVVDDLR